MPTRLKQVSASSGHSAGLDWAIGAWPRVERVKQGFLFVALVLVLLAKAQDLLEDFHIKALSLGFCEDFFLAFIQRLDFVIDVLNSLDEGANAIAGIPAVSVMPAPRFKRSYGRAMKVTENLIEPPKFRLTRAVLLPLAPTPTHNRVSCLPKSPGNGKGPPEADINVGSRPRRNALPRLNASETTTFACTHRSPAQCL